MYEAGIEPRSINHYPEVRPGTGGMLAALHAYDVPLHYSPYLEPPIWPPPPPAPRAPATARTPVHGVKDTRFKENSRWAVERHQNRAGGGGTYGTYNPLHGAYTNNPLTAGLKQAAKQAARHNAPGGVPAGPKRQLYELRYVYGQTLREQPVAAPQPPPSGRRRRVVPDARLF